MRREAARQRANRVGKEGRKGSGAVLFEDAVARKEGVVGGEGVEEDVEAGSTI